MTGEMSRPVLQRPVCPCPASISASDACGAGAALSVQFYYNNTSAPTEWSQMSDDRKSCHHIIISPFVIPQSSHEGEMCFAFRLFWHGMLDQQ